MDNPTATIRLAALAQESRLAVFRALVQAGPTGLNPGALAQSLGIAQATLSFHLKELMHAGLIRRRQESRFLFYSADFDSMNELLGFLTENCCAGDSQQCDMTMTCVSDQESSPA